jgi:hypothetical protein
MFFENRKETDKRPCLPILGTARTSCSKSNKESSARLEIRDTAKMSQSFTSSAQLLLNAPEELMNDPTLEFLEKQFPSSQSMLEIEDLFQVNQANPSNTNLAPLLAKSQEASRPLESSHLTPVPTPIERETHLSSSLFLTTKPPSLPRVHVPRAGVNLEEVNAAAVILDSQWNLFMKA